MKRKISCFLTLMLVIFTAFYAVACSVGSAKATVVAQTETQVVIQVNETDGEAKLTDVMNALQEDGKLTFTIAGGMVTAINGKSNTADVSGCWMLYTSDVEMSNAEWGTIEYDGKTLGSAIVGADALAVVEGGIYVWSYQSF